MQKDTSKIVEELGLCPDFQTFYNENKDYMVSGNLAVLLSHLLEKKGLKKAQVIKNSELSEVYGYQIFSGIRVPERKKLLCLAVSMRLNIEEAQQLLKCAGYSLLYVKKPCGMLGAPERELVAFGKTQVLAPGESQELVLTVPENLLAVFDDCGLAGAKNAWVIVPGTYEFYLGGDVRHAEMVAERSYENPNRIYSFQASPVEGCPSSDKPCRAILLLHP